MNQHALYRFYGDTGQLLYVGITHDPGKRLAQHSATKNWWTAVRGISIEWYSSKQDAAAAERRAIAVERPLANIQRPSMRPVNPRACGHCVSCTTPDHADELCYVMNEVQEDPYCDPCPCCGSDECLYAVGFSHGEQAGWTRAWHHEKARGGA